MDREITSFFISRCPVETDALGIRYDWTNAEPYDGPGDPGSLVEWLQSHMDNGDTVIDIGYDSDNLGEPTLYDFEAQYLNSQGYPRTLVPAVESGGS